jgi:antitoxin component of MazEF toxin-antitoxin module
VLEICDNGDAILELPPEMCEELQWKEGDTLNISLENDNIILKKVPNAT